jgi:predicted ATPase
VRREVQVEALGPVDIRGKSRPVPAYRVVSTRPRSPLANVEDRTLSPFVGRERDLGMLQELVDLVETGQGQVVAIVGEPGVGKSRLLHELGQRLTSRRLTWLEGRCLSYGAVIPFLPVLDILRAGCGVLAEDSPATVAAKLRAGLEEVGFESTESAPYLLHLLGITEGAESVAQLPPEAIKPRAFRILREMSVRGAQHRPI